MRGDRYLCRELRRHREATDPEFRHCALIYLGELALQVRANPSAASASAAASRRAARFTAGGTHRGNGTTRSSCRPLAVWTSRTAARSRRAKLPANRTSAGHNRRCTYVIFPPTSRQTSTSAESRTARVSQKICFPLACPHQLPRIRPPTTASARFVTGPRSVSRTMPLRLTNDSAERRVPLRPSDCLTVRLSLADPATSRSARPSRAPESAALRKNRRTNRHGRRRQAQLKTLPPPRPPPQFTRLLMCSPSVPGRRPSTR